MIHGFTIYVRCLWRSTVVQVPFARRRGPGPPPRPQFQNKITDALGHATRLVACPSLPTPLPPECANSDECWVPKHHFDKCVARVTAADEEPDSKGPQEDCVEECTLSLPCLSLSTQRDSSPAPCANHFARPSSPFPLLRI